VTELVRGNNHLCSRATHEVSIVTGRGLTSVLVFSDVVRDIEMTVEEPVSVDDDGSPHRVSDSESESESGQDSD
jgi:hypothetical protein